MNFWERLDWLIKEKGLTRKDLSIQIGLGVSAVSVWKTRSTYPGADVAVAVARVLGVSVEYLIEGPPEGNGVVVAAPSGEAVSSTLVIPPENQLLLDIAKRLTDCSQEELVKVKTMLSVVLD